MVLLVSSVGDAFRPANMTQVVASVGAARGGLFAHVPSIGCTSAIQAAKGMPAVSPPATASKHSKPASSWIRSTNMSMSRARARG